MTDREILELAKSLGFTGVFLSPSEIPVDEKYLVYCEENRCGNYGANYACPPDCGTPEEMHQKLLTAERALVLQSVWDIPDYGTPEVLTAKAEHNAALRRLMKELRKSGHPCFAVGYGGCNLCSPCKRREEDQPCAFPELRMSCLSAYCVDVTLLAERCHLEFEWNPQKLRLFGMMMFCPEAEREG